MNLFRTVSPVRRSLLTLSLALAAAACPGFAAAADTIKIGLIAERSGNLQSFGIHSYNGTRLAVKEVNDAGGVTVKGRKYLLELVVADSRSDERETSAAAVDLIIDRKIKFLFGALGRLAPIVLKLSEPNKAIYFTTSSAAAALIDKSRYMVLTVPSLDTRVALTVKGIKEIYPDAKRIAFLMTKDSISDEILEPLKKAVDAAGLQISAVETLPSSSADPSAPLTRIRGTKSDVLLVGWGTEPVTAIVRTNREINAAPRLYSAGMGCSEVQKAGIDRPFASNTFAGANIENPSTPEARDLAARYRKFIGDENPTGFYPAVWNYDFIHVLAKAIEAAGTFDDTDAVMAALKKVTHNGVAGKISLDNKGRAVYGLDFCRVESPAGAPRALHINP
jgi:ABC-type branched-subunit amino acid transport system substrate-binding protein